MYINKGAAKTGSALQLVDKVDKLLDGEVNYTIKSNTLGK